ncbi:ribosome biogenesis protein tsr1, variant 2 [Basidiobolus ranarum]
MNYYFPEMDKVHPVDNDPESQTLLRLLSAQHPKSITWREPHPYMLIDKTSFESSPDDDSVGTLQITGYARGAPFSANRLVHLQNYGDFQIKQIVAAKSPNSSSHHESSMAVDSMDGSVDSGILDLPDEDQDDMISEMDPDPMAGEQTWPTEEELAEADERVKLMQAERDAEAKSTKRVPKGTSSYQAAWIVDSGSENEYSDDGEDNNMMGTDDVDSDREEYEDVALEQGNGTDGEDDNDNSDMDEEEEERSFQEYLQRQKESKDDREFPDEVDTPLDISARTRFQRYRGMLSIRTSPWDPFENLPTDYSRIFQFENYPRTKVRVLGQAITGAVKPGSYITIHLTNVPREFIETYDSSRVNVAFGLLQYEHKMSVLNFIVNRNSEYQEPVKSKDPLILHIGFRRLRVQPVYSQLTTKGSNNVHKFERYLQQDLTSVATLYGPIQFGNVPAIFYKEQAGQDPIIVATGSFLNPDPSRIIAKRIILTGYPFKVHKRTAVIRYMFLNPEDVHWFKPIQLTTKYGRTGHIKESLGTHGYMKCMFDGALKQQDTVCMYLYKRVFSKWTTKLYKENEEQEMMIEA